MTREEKLKYLQENHYQEFAQAYKEVDMQYHHAYFSYCLCGKKNSVLHETHCPIAIDYKYTQTIKRLQHYLPKK